MSETDSDLTSEGATEGEYREEDYGEEDYREDYGTTDEQGDEDLAEKLNELRGMMGNIYMQQPYSGIDVILGKEDFELEELLEQDDFLPDLRRGKNNLISYLSRPEVLDQLVHYISSEEVDDDPEPERRKRFAHLAYEAIQSDIIKEALINSPELLTKFFSFLDITSEMDPLRCAYFSRIVELLFEKYPKDLVAYLRRRNCIVAKFIWHLDNQYIVESLFRLIDSQLSHQWLQDEDLIPLLMYKMSECEDQELQEKTAGTFVEILEIFVPFPYSILTTQMFYSEIVAQQWEQFTLSEPENFEKIKNGLNVAVGILNLSYEGNMADDTPVFMTTIVKNLAFFLDILKTPQDPNKTFNMTYGKLTPPFGFLRTKVLEFLNALLNTRYQSIAVAFWKTEIFTILLDLMFFYKWNNTLHFHVDQIICNAIALDSDTGGHGENINSILIQGCKLLDRILEAFTNETPKSVGYMGHLTHIANELNTAAASHATLNTALSEREGWSAFVEGKLAEVNKINSTALAGGVPSGMMGGDVLGQFVGMNHGS